MTKDDLVQSHTFVSFWHVEMSNFPVGTFRRRAVSIAEARGMVNSARSSGTLVCVARGDLAAPYCEEERARHRQLCAALRADAHINIHLKDFFGKEIANPLSFAEIGAGQILLVVDCLYGLDKGPSFGSEAKESVDPQNIIEERAQRRMKRAIKMNVAPDSIRFYCFEYVNLEI